VGQAEDAGKYRAENHDPVQGQVIGDNATVHMHYHGNGPQSPPPTSLWTVPFPRNRFFLGQQALLAELHQNLRRGTATAITQIQAISGLGGIGKTQLALEYAYRYREHYPFVFWVRAEHRETLVTELVTLAGLLHLPQHQEAAKTIAVLVQWLAAHQGWLLIFDNVDDLALIAEYLPNHHTGAILLTTRLAQTQPLAAPLTVNSMDEHAGAEFLLRRARILGMGQVLEDAPASDQQAACQICRLVGGLPLALDQAGAYIDEVQCQVQEYLAFYQRDRQVRTRLLQRRGKGGSGHPEAVATTWALAFSRVEQASQAAADLLRACTFLDPDLIAEDFIRQSAACWSAELARVASNDFEWNETLGELLKYALMRRTREQHTLSLHRLVQTVLRDALDEPTTRRWAESTVRAVDRAFPFGADFANWETCKSLLPHAQRCAELIEQETLSFPEAANLVLNMARYLRGQAWYREAEPLYQRALHIREQQSGPDHSDVAYPLEGLAILYYEQGKYDEAEPLYQQALRIREQQSGPDHPDMAYPLNGLASLYKEQGKYDEAEPLYQRALHIWEQQLGPDHPDVAHPLNNLAGLYKEQGKYDEAEPLYQRALHIWEQQLGPDHPQVAYPLNGLASLYKEQGKYDEAEPLYQRALHIWEQQLGPDHPQVAYPLNGLANLYHAQGKYAEAESLYQRALRIREQQLGPNHPRTRDTRKNYAILLRATNRAEEAKKLEENP
jgi:tetratricopeptide (TPR) repeat protein